MHAAHIAQIVDRVLPERSVVHAVRPRCAPPEPVSVVLMERTKEHGDATPLHAQQKIRDHIEVGRIDRMQIAARNGAVQNMPREIVRRIARKVIAAVRLRALCRAREVGDVHGKRQDRALVRRLRRDPLEFVRTAHARCTLRIGQLQLLARQRECVEPDDPCERARHVLRIGVRTAVDAKKFMMRVVLMSVDRVLQLPERCKIRIELPRLRRRRRIGEMHRTRSSGAEHIECRCVAECLCRVGQNRPRPVDRIRRIVHGMCSGRERHEAEQSADQGTCAHCPGKS